MGCWQSLFPVKSGKWAERLNQIIFWFWGEVKILTLECHPQFSSTTARESGIQKSLTLKVRVLGKDISRIGWLSVRYHQQASHSETPKGAKLTKGNSTTSYWQIYWSEQRYSPNNRIFFLEFLGKLLVSLVSDKPDGSSELMITFWGWNATSGVDQHSSQTDQSLGGTDYYHLLLLLLNHLELLFFFFLWKKRRQKAWNTAAL